MYSFFLGNTQCIFEQTPIVYPFISADNTKQIHVQWDPQLSDYGGMSATAFTAKHTPDGGSELTQVCTSFSSMSPPNSTENRLVLTFPNAFAHLVYHPNHLDGFPGSEDGDPSPSQSS